MTWSIVQNYLLDVSQHRRGDSVVVVVSATRKNAAHWLAADGVDPRHPSILIVTRQDQLMGVEAECFVDCSAEDEMRDLARTRTGRRPGQKAGLLTYEELIARCVSSGARK